MRAVWTVGLSQEHVKLGDVVDEFVRAWPWQPYHTPRYVDPSAVGQVTLVEKLIGTFVHPLALAVMEFTIGGVTSRHKQARLPPLPTVPGQPAGYDHPSQSCQQ